MNFPKEVMSVAELKNMGFGPEWLRDVAAKEGYPLAIRLTPGRPKSKILIDTRELSNYLKKVNAYT